MSDYFNAFDKGPTAERGIDAVPPEIFRGIYAMPMFVTVPTTDLAASTEFWIKALGFIEIFGIPGRMVHLRRWMYQDVLLVPAAERAEIPAMSVSFICVLREVEPLVERCAEILPGSASEPRDTPWCTRDVEIITPENTRVVFTAAREYDPDSREARDLAAVGIVAPGGEGNDSTEGNDNGVRD